MPVAIIGPKFYVYDSNGDPIEGAQIHTYETDGVTRKETFNGENGAANSNPVITNAAGYATVCLDGVYAIVVHDDDGNLVYSENPVTSANELAQVWTNKKTATFATTNSFTIAGNYTDIYKVGRRVQLDDSTMLYGTITASSYSSPNTTVTVSVDDGTLLTANLDYSWVYLFESGDFAEEVANLSALRGINGRTGYNYVFVQSHTDRGDGGNGNFRWVSGAAPGTYVDNNGTIIVPTGGDGSAAWLREILEFVNPEMFGAAGDNTTDDTAAINAAADYARSIGATFRGGPLTYRITSTVNLRSMRLESPYMTINCDFTGSVGVELGGNASSVNNPTQDIRAILRVGGATSDPTARIMGAKNQKISIHRCEYVQIASETAVNYDLNYSTGYSQFYFNYVERLHLRSDGPINAWINENDIYLKRCSYFVADSDGGPHTRNHNFFHGGTFEAASTLNITNDFWSNHFREMRFEGTPTITIAGSSNCFGNTFEVTWSPNGTTDLYQSNVTFVDNDGRNRLYTAMQNTSPFRLIASLSVNDPQYNNRSYPSALSGDIYSVRATTNATTDLLECPFVRVAAGDEILGICTGPSGATLRYRFRVEFYDEDLNAVSVTTADYASGNFSGTGTFLETGTGASSAKILVRRTTLIKYVRFVIRSSFNQQSNWLAQSINIYIRSQNPPIFYGSGGGVGKRNPLTVSAIPTQALLAVGTRLIKSDASEEYVCTFSLKTTGTWTTASSTIVVASATGVTTGDIVGIFSSANGGQTAWGTVSGVSGTDITLSFTPGNDQTDKTVVFCRLATKTL